MNNKMILIAIVVAFIPAVVLPQVRTPALKQTHFVAEVPPASLGGTVQVGVKLPLGAKIARTKVQVARTDLGADTRGWSNCDVDTKACDLDGSSIIRFHRNNVKPIQELAADMRNKGSESYYVKLTVIFQPQAGRDRTECGNSMNCGFVRAIRVE